MSTEGTSLNERTDLSPAPEVHRPEALRLSRLPPGGGPTAVGARQSQQSSRFLTPTGRPEVLRATHGGGDVVDPRSPFSGGDMTKRTTAAGDTSPKHSPSICAVPFGV